MSLTIGLCITYKDSAVGTAPGRLIEINAEGDIIHEWREDVTGRLNILGEHFSPHGLAVDFNKGIISTSNFAVPITILKQTLGIQKASTLRLWILSDQTIISTINIPNGLGIRYVKFIPGNPKNAAIAAQEPSIIFIQSNHRQSFPFSAVGPRQAWIIYPFRRGSSGKQGIAEVLYDLDSKAKESLNLNYGKRLDNPNEKHPIIGPHYVKISFNRTIDFESIFIRGRDGVRPHSSIIFDLADTENPKIT